MNLNEFTRLLAQKRHELDTLMRRKLPVKVGAMAKAHYQDNIRERQGFLNGGLQPWPKTKRQQSGGKAASANYGALLSSRKHLYSSIKYTPSDYKVVVANDLKYAPVHNWGATITMPPRKQVIHFNKKGKFSKLKLANTAMKVNRKSHTITIPQRQFLGESQELNAQIQQKMDSEIRNILNKE